MQYLDEAWRVDLGRIDYQKAMRLQEQAKKKVREGESGWVFVLEHPPTITLGYSLKGDEGRSWIRDPQHDIEAQGITVVQVDRGGKATYHGPGQTICYLVLDLKRIRLSVKRYMGKLQDAVMEALQDIGLPAELDPSYPGVWVRGSKIAAVGVRVQDRITSHGLAVNMDPQLEGFDHIVPCGIPDKPITSVVKETGQTLGEEFTQVLINRLQEELRIRIYRT